MSKFANSDSSTTTFSGNLRILHVDDDVAFLDVSKRILESENNFDIDNALSVDEAFQKMEQHSYDAIISDYEMPERTGLDFLKAIRLQKRAIPFVLFTGKGREEVAVNALNLGADGYYNKIGSTETVYGELVHGILSAVNRRKAEEALKLSEESYSELINGMNDTAWVIDFNANFVEVNDTAVKVLGYSKEEFLSMGPSDIDDSLSKEQIQDLVRRMSVDHRQVFETTHTAKDGTIIPVEISSNLVNYKGKQAVLSIARNITERKKAEQILRESEESLRLKLDFVLSPDVDIDEQELTNIIDVPALQAMMNDLYEVTKMAFALIDLKGNMLVKTGWQDICTQFHRANAQTAKNCTESDLELSNGVKQGDFRLYKCKNNLWDIVTPLIINNRHVGNLFSGQFFFDDEQINRDDFVAQAEKYGFNKEEYLSAFDKVPRFSRKKVEHLMLFTVHISEMVSKLSFSNLKIAKALSDQKTIENELRESEQKFRAINESAVDAIFLFDEDDRITYWNPAAERIFGYSEKEVIGKTVNAVIVPPRYRKEHLTLASEIGKAKANKNVSKLMEFPAQKKEGSEFLMEFSMSPLQLSGNQYFVAIARDITERKRIEWELKQAMEQLVLANEKLHVVGGLTRHDVRNKLCTVTGNAYLLKKKYNDQAYIVDGLDKIDRAVREVDAIFSFDKLYEQLGVEDLSYIDVETKVFEGAAFFSDSNVKVVNACKGLTLLADSFLRQLFYDLIDNTIKHGKKVTEVRVYFEKANSDDLQLIYQDDGVGVDEKNKLMLFDEGFSTGGSTGYGLFLIKRMMDIYGWTIHEAGQQGQGAKFIITIPKLNKNGKENYQIRISAKNKAPIHLTLEQTIEMQIINKDPTQVFSQHHNKSISPL